MSFTKAVEAEYESLVSESKGAREGRYTWRVQDFDGVYHLSRIKNKYPIPGSALRLERDRAVGQAYREEQAGLRLAHITERLRQESAHKGRVAVELANTRAKYGARSHAYAALDKTIAQKRVLFAEQNSRTQREAKARHASPNVLSLEFFKCVRQGSVQRVESYLARALVDVNLVEADGSAQTALKIACSLHRIGIVRALLHHGADANQRDSNGSAPVHAVWAPLAKIDANDRAERRNKLNAILAILKDLANHGAAMELRDAEGNSVLHMAAREDACTICAFLLEHVSDAHLEERNKKQQTCIDMIESKSSDCFHLIRTWTLFKRHRRLAEFRKEWMAYLKRDDTHPHLEVNPTAAQALVQIEMDEFNRESNQVTREKVGVGINHIVSAGGSEGCIAENSNNQTNDFLPEVVIPLSQFRRKTESNDTETVLGKIGAGPRPILAYVKDAERQYTRQYREDAEEHRSKLKPSNRTLTLVEYLVGSNGLKKAKHRDKKREQQASSKRMSLSERRRRAALFLLEDQALTGTPKSEKGSTSPSRSSSLARPWTVSSLGQPRSRCRPQALHRAAKASVAINQPTVKDISSVVSKINENSATRCNLSSSVKPRPSSRSTKRRNALLGVNAQALRKEIEEIEMQRASGYYVERDSEMRPHNAPSCLPPLYDPMHHFSVLGTKGGQKLQFTPLDIAEAVRNVRAQHSDNPDFIPPSFDAAIHEFVTLLESSRTTTTTGRLVNRLAGVKIGKGTEEDQAATKLIVSALVDELEAAHKQDLLHPSLRPYVEKGHKHKQRPSNRKRFFLLDPWNGPSAEG